MLNERLAVSHINRFDIEGGAARAAYRLHQGMRSIGVDSRMLVLRKSSDDESVDKVSGILGECMSRLNPRLDGLPLKRYPHRQRQSVWSLNQVPYPIAKRLNQLQVDLFHLHWVGSGYIPISQLKHIRKPVIWTLHDEWAFTGGCHYASDCKRFMQTCGACPQLHSKKENDLSRHILLQKLQLWNSNDLTIVTPSHWLANEARQSAVLQGKRIEVIPNGINTAHYKPVDRGVARDLLNLPADKRLILFGAVSSTKDPRKGFQLLRLAVERLASVWGEQAELIVIGASERSDNPDMALKARYLGYLHDDASLALMYSAADVFVAPSIQENLPNTVMEALACGTPCVAFNIGGLPDMIEHQRNGYLAAPYEPEDLAKGIAWVLEDQERHIQLRARARAKIEDEFELGKIAAKYRDLYREILGRTSVSE